MKYYCLFLILISPFLSNAQADKGGLSAGVQMLQNVALPDGYAGFGIGGNVQLDVYRGIGVVGHFNYELNDLSNAGSLKRLQRGIALNYIPFYSKKLSPWVQVGAVYNSIEVTPVSYLFADNSANAVTQNYFSLNIGLGGLYHINDQLTVNTGVYLQPQNYRPNYDLTSSEIGTAVETNIFIANPQVDPLVYFNIGFTYKIAKLW